MQFWRFWMQILSCIKKAAFFSDKKKLLWLHVVVLKSQCSRGCGKRIMTLQPSRSAINSRPARATLWNYPKRTKPRQASTATQQNKASSFSLSPFSEALRGSPTWRKVWDAAWACWKDMYKKAASGDPGEHSRAAPSDCSDPGRPYLDSLNFSFISLLGFFKLLGVFFPFPQNMRSQTMRM